MSFHHVGVRHSHLAIDGRIGVRVECCIRHALVLLVLVWVAATVIVYLTDVGGVH